MSLKTVMTVSIEELSKKKMCMTECVFITYEIAHVDVDVQYVMFYVAFIHVHVNATTLQFSYQLYKVNILMRYYSRPKE